MMFDSCVSVNVLLTCNLPKVSLIFACFSHVKTIQKILCDSGFVEPMLRDFWNDLYLYRVAQSKFN